MRVLACLALFLLAACGAETGDRAPGNDATPAKKAPIQPAGEQPAEAFAWTGRFAATPQLCEGGAWQIGRDRIVTAGEMSCDVRAVEETAGQAILDLSCIGEGMESQERWTLTRTDSGMRASRAVDGETIDVDLIRCD